MTRHHLLSRRRLAILLAVTVVLAVLTALFMIAQDGTTAQSSVPSSVLVAGGQSAQQARQVLDKWMVGWAEEAALVTASCSLIKGEENADPWTFLVYAPQRERIAVVAVVGTEVLVLRERAALYPQPSIDEQAWRIDSTELLERWWQQVGAGTWARSEVQSLHVRLGVDDGDVVSWRVSVLDTDGSLVNYWEMAADTGEVLSHSTP